MGVDPRKVVSRYSRGSESKSPYFPNYLPIPRRSSLGQSFSPLMVKILWDESGVTSCRVQVEVYGKLQGDLQSVTDEIRFAQLEMNEFLRRWLPMLGNHRVTEQPGVTVEVAEKGLHLVVYRGLRFPKLTRNQAMTQIQRALDMYGPGVSLVKTADHGDGSHGS